MKATGVNNHTKAQLKELMATGYDAEEISSMIQVEQSAVENWMKSFSKEVKAEGVTLPQMSNSRTEIYEFAVAHRVDIGEDDTKEMMLEAINKHFG
jgi:transposase